MLMRYLRYGRIICTLLLFQKNTCFNIPQLSHSKYFSLFLKFSIYGPYSLLLIFSFLGWGGGGRITFGSEDFLGFCFKSNVLHLD